MCVHVWLCALQEFSIKGTGEPAIPRDLQVPTSVDGVQDGEDDGFAISYASTRGRSNATDRPTSAVSSATVASKIQ